MNILAVRVGRVGDTVMMTPALTALIKYYPDAEITLLVSPVGKLLLNDFHLGEYQNPLGFPRPLAGRKPSTNLHRSPYPAWLSFAPQLLEYAV